MNPSPSACAHGALRAFPTFQEVSDHAWGGGVSSKEVKKMTIPQFEEMSFDQSNETFFFFEHKRAFLAKPMYFPGSRNCCIPTCEMPFASLCDKTRKIPIHITLSLKLFRFSWEGEENTGRKGKLFAQHLLLSSFPSSQQPSVNGSPKSVGLPASASGDCLRKLGGHLAGVPSLPSVHL